MAADTRTVSSTSGHQPPGTALPAGVRGLPASVMNRGEPCPPCRLPCCPSGSRTGPTSRRRPSRSHRCFSKPPGVNPKRCCRNCTPRRMAFRRTEAERRLQEYGPNVVAREERHPRIRLLGKALINPLVILLLVLAASSFLTGDFRAGSVMLLMVILGVVLRFVQEARADSAAAKLRAMISVHATVLRDGQPQEVPIGHLVPGDVVRTRRRRHDPGRRAAALVQRPVPHPGQPDRGVVPGREIRRPGRGRGPIAPGTDQRLLPGHERRERGRHGGRRGHRPDDLPRRHVQRHRGAAGSRPASTGA